MMSKAFVFIFIFCFGVISLQAQNTTYSKNPQTALDFLTLSLDSRSAGIGDAGIGTPADNYSHQHNPSKYIFTDKKGGLALTYSPWLRNLVKDMNITSLTGYYVIDTLQSVSSSFRFFSMGEMEFRDNTSQYTGSRSPYQLAFDAAYSRKLSQYLGASIGFRLALADLYPSALGYKKGWGLAADLNFYYHRPLTLGNLPALLSAGASLTNIGTKVSFQKNGSSYFMPMQFRLGAAFQFQFKEEHSLMLAGELSRSLVPVKAENLDDSSIGGLFSSIKEGDFRSIAWALGLEYGFRDMLFGRTGYHHESEAYGNRKYLTFGAGFSYSFARFDFSYLVPTGSKYNSMGNTLRISLGVAFN